jgi:hypothetical protein
MTVDKDEGLALPKIIVSKMYSSYFFDGHAVWLVYSKVMAR